MPDKQKQSVLHTDITELAARLLPKLKLSRAVPGGHSKQLALFCRQFAFLSDSGADITRAFHVLTRGSGRADGFARGVAKVGELLMKGESLSAAMETQAHWFPSLLRSMTRAGESSGSLGAVMADMADYYEKEHASAEELKSAMLYPVVVSVMMLAVIVIALLYVVPSYSAIFASAGAQLPLVTRVMISLSEFLMRRYPWVIAVILIGVLAAGRALRRPGGRCFADRCALSLGPWAVLNRKVINLRFAQTLALLLGSGLHLIPALDIVCNVVGNLAVERELDALKAALAEGASLSEALEGSGYLEPLLHDMISVGESSGRLPETLAKCAAYFQEEYDTLAKRLNKLVEPAVTAVLGLVTGFIILAVMLPMVSVTEIL